MKPIFGYGSPRFRLGSLEATFAAHHGAGRVEFEPSVHEYETLEGDDIEVFKGWRGIMKLRLWNVKSGDYLPHLRLIQIINTSKKTGLPIKCSPRQDSPNNLELDMVFKGKFGYEELTNLNAGQQIELEFRSQKLMCDVPGFVNTEGYLLVSEGSYLLLDSNGSRLIMPTQGHTEIIYDENNM